MEEEGGGGVTPFSFGCHPHRLIPTPAAPQTVAELFESKWFDSVALAAGPGIRPCVRTLHRPGLALSHSVS